MRQNRRYLEKLRNQYAVHSLIAVLPMIWATALLLHRTWTNAAMRFRWPVGLLALVVLLALTGFAVRAVFLLYRYVFSTDEGEDCKDVAMRREDSEYQ